LRTGRLTGAPFCDGNLIALRIVKPSSGPVFPADLRSCFAERGWDATIFADETGPKNNSGAGRAVLFPYDGPSG